MVGDNQSKTKIKCWLYLF